jgi:hypothetical protein
MLKRADILFFVAVLIVFASLFLLPLIYVGRVAGATDAFVYASEAYFYNNKMLLILGILVALLALISALLFRNRTAQLRVSRIGAFTSWIFLALALLVPNLTPELESFQYGPAYWAAVIIPACFLAATRNIRREKEAESNRA